LLEKGVAWRLLEQSENEVLFRRNEGDYRESVQSSYEITAIFEGALARIAS